MKERTLTSIAIVFVVAVIFLTKIIIGINYIFDAFIGIIAIMSALEMANILKRIGMYNYSYVIASFPILAYILLILCQKFQFSVLLTVLLFFGLLVLIGLICFCFTFFAVQRAQSEIRVRKLIISRTKFAVNKAGYTFLGLVYPSIFILILCVLNNLSAYNYITALAGDFGITLSIFALAIAFLIPFISDTFAYLTGSAIGGKKLAPKISEKKTISGAIGAIFWTSTLFAILFLIFNSTEILTDIIVSLGLTWWHFAILGAIGSIACQCGDLFESYLKRKADLKDSADILPGHGGLLDRVDGMIVSNIVVLVFFIIILV